MSFFNVLTLAGGLAFFLYGMKVMSSSLERLAGGKFEAILQAIMSNKFKALLLGVGVPAAIQSSSAPTVMVIGLVNSEIMSLDQAINVILGAKVGTTVTAWLLSLTGISSENFFLQLLKPSSFSPVLALIGVIFIIRNKSTKQSNIGRILVGFAVLMAGISTMGDAMSPLGESEQFYHVMQVLSNPFLAFFVGVALTALVQSSSASVGILQAISLSTPVGYAVVVPMVVGQNVGASIAPLIASIGQEQNGKRAAFSYLFANIIGAIVFFILFYSIHLIVGFEFMKGAAGIVGIAVIHTLFNIFVVFVLFPFTKYLGALMIKILPDSEAENELDRRFAVMDENFLSSPTFALVQTKGLIDEMAEKALSITDISTKLISHYDENIYLQVEAIEQELDRYQDEIGKYLIKLGRKNMASADSKALSLHLQSVDDLERISDHALNIAESCKEMHEKKITFSEAARSDLRVIISAVHDIMTNTVIAFAHEDQDAAENVEPLEEVIDELTVLIKDRHLERLKSGECDIDSGFDLTEIITNLERISDHCSNLAIYIIQMRSRQSIEAHEYLDTLVRDRDEEFVNNYKWYRGRYKLP